MERLTRYKVLYVQVRSLKVKTSTQKICKTTQTVVMMRFNKTTHCYDDLQVQKQLLMEVLK